MAEPLPPIFATLEVIAGWLAICAVILFVVNEIGWRALSRLHVWAEKRWPQADRKD